MDLPALDVVVIGAGPAGAHCARLLAAGGREVAILEARAPGHPKVCGGLLNRRAQAIIEQWGGLPEQVRVGAGAPALEFPALEYHDLDNRRRARYDPGYRNIDRRAFDAWLVEAAQSAGTQLRYNTRVTRLTPVDDRVELTAGRDRFSARTVIDASGGLGLSRRGLAGPAIRRLHAIQGTVELTPDPGAMWGIYLTSYTPFFSWIIPKGQGRFLLGSALTRDGIRRLQVPGSAPPAGRLGGWSLLGPVLDYLARHGHAVRTVDNRPRGTPLCLPGHRSQLWWGHDRILAIGEATGLVSPFSGEGISFALDSAEIAARVVLGGDGAALLQSQTAGLARRISRAGLRARIGATPWLRPWGLWLLPHLTGSSLAALPWIAEPGK